VLGDVVELGAGGQLDAQLAHEEVREHLHADGSAAHAHELKDESQRNVKAEF
jgi:hypothetical protein